MAEPQQIIIEFIADTTQLQPGIDKLVSTGKIDQKSAAIFKQTNEQLKERNTLLDQAKKDTDSITTSVTREQAIYNKLVASLKNLSGASKEAVKELLKLSPEEVSAGFDKAAVSVDDYLEVLEKTGEQSDETQKKMQSLRQELKQITEQIAVLTLNGETNSKEFETLSLRAGKLRNALDDARQTVAGLGQDVPTLQVFSRGLQTISAGFTLAQGASALFGDENKDLQQTLVKVNAVMAVNAGIQEILNTLSDEALINTARQIALQKIRNAQILIENGLQSQSAIVRGAAAAAQYALNLAISLSPIGIAITALAAFVAGIIIYVSRAREAAKAQAELNAALESAGNILDADFQGIDNVNKKIVASLQERNARQSEIDQADIVALKARNKSRQQEIERLNNEILKNQDSSNSDILEAVQKARDKQAELEKEAYDARTELVVKETELRKQQLNEQLEDLVNNIQARLTVSEKNSNQEFSLRRELARAEATQEINDAGDNAAKIQAIRAQLARNLKDIDIAQAQVTQNIISANLRTALIKSQNESRAINDRQSQEEIDRQKAIILEQAEFDVKQEGLKQSQIKEIREKALQQANELQKQFDREQIQLAIQDQISLNNATLAQINLSEKEKLDLRIQNIILSASAEIEQNRGKIDKIKELEAKRDADIKAVRLASIEDTVTREIKLQELQQAAQVRGIETALAAQDEINNAQGLNGDKRIAAQLKQQKLSTDQQKDLIDQLTSFQIDAVNKRIDATNEEFVQGLISYKDYEEKVAELEDQSVKIHEDAEKRKTDITKKEADKRKARNEEILKDSLQGISDGIGVLAQFYQQDADAANARLEAQKQRIQDLQDAGAISAKEASARNKKLDVEQKQLQLQQAKRQKELDLFQAILNTALAVTNALTTGDPYTAPLRAAIAGAIGAAQIALIASRPLPQFGKGKKNSYQGWAEVGETGPELIRRKGKYYLQNDPAVMYVHSADRIYSPKETLDILTPHNEFPETIVNVPQQKDFDYERLGKEVGKNVAKYGLAADENGLFEYRVGQKDFTKYLNKRRTWRSK